MTAALILLAAIVGTGAVLWLTDGRRQQNPSDGAADASGEGCCGMHITCERDSLLAAVSDSIDYYDDEELDRFAGRDGAAYDDGEIEEFRDVLLTMRPDDIAGWARSLQLRNITLPAAVRDELIMIVSEARAQRNIDHA